jgi:hypothetical protein
MGQAQQRGRRRVLQAGQIGLQVQRVLGDEDVVRQLERQLQHPVLQRDQVLELHGLHLGDADLEDDDEGEQEEHQQPKVGQTDDGAAPADQAAQAVEQRVHQGRTLSVMR